MTRVLIIEDEKVLRSSMERGLSKLPNIEVVGAENLEEALNCIDQSPPQLILSDLDLPGRSGIELLGELGKRGINVPVVYISAFLAAFRPLIPPNSNFIEVLEKPVSLETLRALVRRRLDALNSEARYTPFRAADFLQIACLGKYSVVIDIEQKGQIVGKIEIVNGDVWSAADMNGCGNDAFMRLVFYYKDAHVQCHTPQGEPGERNIEGSWEALLIDAARLYDEKDKYNEKDKKDNKKNQPKKSADFLNEESLQSGVEKKQLSDEADFEKDWDRGVLALVEKDYARALIAFLAARKIRPGDLKVESNIQRLREMGYDEQP